LANFNQGSRREIERLINNKKIYLNKILVTTPATFASTNDEIFIENKKVIFNKKIEILKFYKPKDIICSKNKQDNRKIIYEIIKPKYKNYIFSGRLDFKSEGLIILTNSSMVTRNLELPSNKFSRTYEVRVFGNLEINKLENLSKGFKIDSLIFKPFKFKIKSKIKKNTIIEMVLQEGKKNEIRKIFKTINMQVNRLKRISFGPFLLNKMQPGNIEKITNKELDIYENHIGQQKR